MLVAAVKFNMIIFSCYCLFDVCCLAKENDKSFEEVGKRISVFCKNRYEEMIANGLCPCQLCKPIQFMRKSNWIICIRANVRNDDSIYVSCRERATERIEAMQVLPSQKGRLYQGCLNKELHQNVLWGENVSWFCFYLESLIEIPDFCANCKAYFMQMRDLRLKKVEIAKKCQQQKTAVP